MGALSRLYDRVIAWSAHPKAPRILAALSFAESSFFPIPPDVMLGPMCLAQPRKGWAFALNCTLSSVVGGVAGYLIGRLAFDSLQPWLMSSPYAGAFEQAVSAFESWGFWYILLAGFTPIPYKVFTISAGVVGMPPLPFIAGSLVGRGGRFFLVAGIVRTLGDDAAGRIRFLVDRAGWAMLGLAAFAFGLWYWWSHLN
jgi:membrane protein YqaA with SNARE-associated domain